MKRYVILAICWLAFPVGAIAAERYAVMVQGANVRSGPGTTYDWIWKVGKYYPIVVEKKKGKWYFFKDFEGDEGWIHNSLLDKIPTVITCKETCNIRSGPGTRFDIAFTVGLGIPFRVIERKGNRIHVEHSDGDKGWIHKSLVW